MNQIDILLVTVGMLAQSLLTFFICWKCMRPNDSIVQEDISDLPVEIIDDDDEEIDLNEVY